MKIYLDNSVLNRPFDDQSVSKIRLETTAFFFILDLVDKKIIQLVNSSVIEYENFKNPFPNRKIWIEHYLCKAVFYQKINEKIKQRAKEIEKLNIFSLDSLHLACAEAANVEYFVTCDDEIIKKYKGKIKMVDPIKFLQVFKQK